MKDSPKYIIKKDKDEDDLKYIIEHFEEPDKFLTMNPKIRVGKLFLNKNKKEKKLTKIKSMSLFEKATDSPLLKKFNIQKVENYHVPSLLHNSADHENKINSSHISRNRIFNRPKSSVFQKKIYQKENDSIHYYFKNFQEILSIFKNSKEREARSLERGTDNLIPDDIDINIKKNYIGQERVLKKANKERSKTKKFSRILSAKCNKKEKDLLINHINDYRLKKQIYEFLENKKPLYEKFGDNYWLFNLHRNGNPKKLRINYSKIRKSENEKGNDKCDQIIEFPLRDIEMIIDANNLNVNIKKYNQLIKKLKLTGIDTSGIEMPSSKRKIKIPNLEKIIELKVNGKKLLNQEYNTIINNNDKKESIRYIYYKDPLEKNPKNVNNFIISQNYSCKEKTKMKKVNSTEDINENINNRNKNKKVYHISKSIS